MYDSKVLGVNDNSMSVASAFFLTQITRSQMSYTKDALCNSQSSVHSALKNGKTYLDNFTQS